MNPQILQLPDGPEIRAYIESEQASIEHLLAVAKTAAQSPEGTVQARALQLRAEAKVRTKKLLELLEWLDLQ